MTKPTTGINLTNLIVNYLPQTTTSDELKAIFQSVGRLESCRLIKDKTTQQSLCYGFINYANEDDAERAIKTFNGLNLQNKIIKVSYARPSSESIKGANLYVCGLPKTWTCEEMNKYFGVCGKIITSRILYNQLNGLSKGVGFIRFDQRQEAEIAVRKLNGIIPEGSQEPIGVKFANYPGEIKDHMDSYCQSLPENDTSLTRLTTLPKNIVDQTLSSAFQTKHPLCVSDPFCHGDNLLQPAMLVSSHLSQVLNKPVPSAALTTNTTGWCIFVYNLAPEAQENTLWELFGPFGAVFNVKIIRDFNTQKCKGFGFVTMTSYEEAVRAISFLNGVMIANRQLQVSLKTTLKI